MDYPQLVTQISPSGNTITTTIEAPWVSVTSVNGQTGDVITRPIIEPFASNMYYIKDTIVSHINHLYQAKENFTSGSVFNEDDWNEVARTSGVANITSDDESVTLLIDGETVDLSITDSLKDYVQKETGKGLSTNDFSTNEKNKLGNIEARAQKNVQSDWNQTSTNADDFIKNKPTIPILYSSVGHLSDGAMTQNASTVNFLQSQQSIQTESIDPYITTSQIADSAVTSSKLASWSITSDKIVDNSIIGQKIMDATINTTKITNRAVDNYKIDYDLLTSGAVLVSAQNSDELRWSGTSKTEWTLGTWTQFGMFARASGNMNRIKITVPDDEDWEVCISHQISMCHINGNYAWSGIKDITSGKYKTSCLTANGDLYLPQQSEFFEIIPAGTTKEYGVFIFTSTSAQCRWYGGGDSTTSGTEYNFGKSCVLKATLIRRIGK